MVIGCIVQAYWFLSSVAVNVSVRVAPAGLRAQHQGRLIAVDGTITSIGGVRTRPVEVAYEW